MELLWEPEMTEPLFRRSMVAAVVAIPLLILACTGTNEEQLAENGTAGREPARRVTATFGPAPLNTGDVRPVATPVDTASRSGSNDAAAASPAPLPSPSDGQPQPQGAPEDVDLLAMHGELAEDFQTLGELVSAAPVIVLARVLESRDAPYGNLPFTVLTIEVEQAFKGAVAAGGRLTVVETGGLLRGSSKIDPGQYAPPAEMAFAGVPVMKVGERWLLFLGSYDPGPVATNAYSVKGVFQGKLKVGGDGRMVFTGPADRIQEPVFAVPAYVNGRALPEVIADITSALFGS